VRSLDPDASGGEHRHDAGLLAISAAASQPRGTGDRLEKRLLQAAEAGDARSQCNLGIIYANGLDDNGYAVKGNKAQAVKWLSAVAEQGFPRAQLKLPEVYAEAPDLSGGHSAACRWFLVAMQRLCGIHLHHARSGYEHIASQLTAAQIAKARRFARDWTPKLPARAAHIPAKQTDGGGAQ
jgi:TPR repeat protein